MLRLALALALVALVAVASAQNNTNPTCDSQACSKLQGACGANVALSSGKTSFAADVGCALGTICSGGVCVAQATIGQSCTASVGCWDSHYTSIGCISGTCQYYNIYGPGEACDTTDTNLANGGCITGQTCNNGLCSSNAAGVSPNTTAGTIYYNAYCAPNTYFNGTACASQLSSGTTCVADYQCAAGLICGTGSKCQSPFTQAAGGSCVSVFDCQANLRCLAGKCTAIPKTGESCVDASGSSSDTDNSICTTNGDAGVGCVCGTAHASAKDTNGHSVAIEFPNGKATCVDGLEHFSSSKQNAWSSIQSCLKNANCNDLNKLAASGVLGSGPGQCVSASSCFQSAYKTGYEQESLSYNTCAFGGSSAFILPSVVAIIALVLAALL